MRARRRARARWPGIAHRALQRPPSVVGQRERHLELLAESPTGGAGSGERDGPWRCRKPEIEQHAGGDDGDDVADHRAVERRGQHDKHAGKRGQGRAPGQRHRCRPCLTAAPESLRGPRRARRRR